MSSLGPPTHVFGLDAGQLNSAPALIHVFLLLSLLALGQLPRTERRDQTQWMDALAPSPAAAAPAVELCTDSFMALKKTLQVLPPRPYVTSPSPP